MHTLRLLLMSLVLSLPTFVAAQQAIDIDQNGTVTIPGQLRAGSVHADNLDQTLTDLMNEVKGLKSDIAALNRALSRSINDGEWYVYAPTVAAAMNKVTDADVLNNEFGLLRNRGFRSVHFSSWNKGMRLTTEPYMTGDGPPSAIVGEYYLGGSVWITGDALVPEGARVFPFNDPNFGKVAYSTATEVCGTSRAYHMYYKYFETGVFPTTGNRCRDDGPVYARKRSFK